MIDAPRTIVFVHGVQWEPDSELAGYSLPLARAVERQAPSTRFRFKEVLWSDVVEARERQLLQIGKLIDVIGGADALGNLAHLLLEHIFKRQGLQLPFSRSDLLGSQISDLIKGSGMGFKEKAFSAILDVLIYESHVGTYRAEIQQKVQDAIDSVKDELAPVVYGHSLGSAIAYDVLADKADGHGLPAIALITAGSPLGVLARKIEKAPGLGQLLRTSMFWKNYYDADDFLAFWNPLKAFGFRDCVEDRAIDVSTIPFYSHTRYWTSDEIARDLADWATTGKTPAE